MKTRINTVWNVRTYDVWGNARDGFDVNDSYNCGDVNITCDVETHNVGTDREFSSAHPSKRAIRAALGLTGERFGIDIDGDDLSIYVNRADNGRPIGELFCVSHQSLSPIQA